MSLIPHLRVYLQFEQALPGKLCFKDTEVFRVRDFRNHIFYFWSKESDAPIVDQVLLLTDWIGLPSQTWQ